jgi:hypothetical protein
MMIALAELRVRRGDPLDTSLLLVRHCYGWALLVSAAAAVGGRPWFAVADDGEQFCADVGVATHMSGSAPRDAMSARVRSQEVIPRTGLRAVSEMVMHSWAGARVLVSLASGAGFCR